MKLYVLKNINKKIIAISEDRDFIIRYILLKNINEFDISKISNKKEIIKLTNSFSELMLNEFDEFILTSEELNIVNNSIDEFTCRITDSINNLLLIKDYLSIISNKDKNNIDKVIKLLRRINKPKRISILLDIKQFIFYIFKTNISDLFIKYK